MKRTKKKRKMKEKQKKKRKRKVKPLFNDYLFAVCDQVNTFI